MTSRAGPCCCLSPRLPTVAPQLGPRSGAAACAAARHRCLRPRCPLECAAADPAGQPALGCQEALHEGMPSLGSSRTGRQAWQADVHFACLQVAEHEALHRPPVHAGPQHAQVAHKGGALGGQPAGRGAPQPRQVHLFKEAAPAARGGRRRGEGRARRDATDQPSRPDAQRQRRLRHQNGRRCQQRAPFGELREAWPAPTSRARWGRPDGSQAGTLLTPGLAPPAVPPPGR